MVFTRPGLLQIRGVVGGFPWTVQVTNVERKSNLGRLQCSWDGRGPPMPGRPEVLTGCGARVSCSQAVQRIL